MKTKYEDSPMFCAEIVLTDEEREILRKAYEVVQTLYEVTEDQARRICDKTDHFTFINYNTTCIEDTGNDWIAILADDLDLLANRVGNIEIGRD